MKLPQTLPAHQTEEAEAKGTSTHLPQSLILLFFPRPLPHSAPASSVAADQRWKVNFVDSITRGALKMSPRTTILKSITSPERKRGEDMQTGSREGRGHGGRRFSVPAAAADGVVVVVSSPVLPPSVLFPRQHFICLKFEK